MALLVPIFWNVSCQVRSSCVQQLLWGNLFCRSGFRETVVTRKVTRKYCSLGQKIVSPYRLEILERKICMVDCTHGEILSRGFPHNFIENNY